MGAYFIYAILYCYVFNSRKDRVPTEFSALLQKHGQKFGVLTLSGQSIQYNLICGKYFLRVLLQAENFFLIKPELVCLALTGFSRNTNKTKSSNTVKQFISILSFFCHGAQNTTKGISSIVSGSLNKRKQQHRSS